MNETILREFIVSLGDSNRDEANWSSMERLSSFHERKWAYRWAI